MGDKDARLSEAIHQEDEPDLEGFDSVDQRLIQGVRAINKRTAERINRKLTPEELQAFREKISRTPQEG